MQSNEQAKSPTLPLKNLAGALLFAVFLGPVGLLYASTFGGIVMICVTFIVSCAKLFVPVIMAWIICCVWAVFAVNTYNKKLMG